MKKRILSALVLMLFAASLFAQGAGEAAAADDYPSKDIQCIVIAAAGGGTDAMARAVTGPLEKQLGKSIVVINNGSAGGLVATGDIADAEPDGYTLGVFSNTDVAGFAYSDKSNGIDVNNYTYIAALNTTGNIIIAKKGSEIKDMDSLIAYCKANPGKLTLGLPSATQKMDHELVNKTRGIDTTAVVYSGGNKVFADLLGGHIEAAILSAKFIKQAKENGMSVIGIMLSDRLSTFPDVPTFKEQGYDINNPAMRMLVGPKGIPQNVVDKLIAELEKGYQGDMTANISAIGECPVLLTGAKLQEFLKSDFAMREAFLSK